MPCIRIASHTILCVGYGPFRLPLADGRRVFVEFDSHYKFPFVTRDRWQNREIEDWYKDRHICNAIDWAAGRGYRA